MELSNLRTEQDERWMRVALEQARKALWKTYPNPAVGAVIVNKDQEVLSKGYHRKAGGPHAEICAIRNLPDPAMARGAEIYITLEPCSTTGKTPPCTDAIRRHGFRRVVYGTSDPNPLHAGRAKRILEADGIEVTEGVLEEECRILNREWNHWITTGLPWVILKAGMSLDGRLVPPPPLRWVTSPASRRDSMALRARASAILVGGETFRQDRPKLTLRGAFARTHSSPKRVVWSKHPESLPREDAREGLWISSASSFAELLKELGAAGVCCVLVEGGGRVHGEAVDSGLVQEVAMYIAPKIFGGGVTAVRGLGAEGNSDGLQLREVVYSQIGQDVKISALVEPRACG